jgi:formiminotetrahydrofolate cyclodeaminase
MYCDKSLKEYLNDLAAKLPAPGGGSAAALSAALGAALLSMVVNFTLGKPKYIQFEDELRAILEESEKLRAEFLHLVDLDVTAYQSKDARNALNVPLMLARLCFAGMQLCLPLIKRGNLNLASDVSSAAILLEGAFASAVCNVEINLKLLQDRKLSSAVRKELLYKEKQVKKIRQDTEAKIGKIIRG